MRKLSFFLLTLVVVASLAACGGAANPAADPTAAPTTAAADPTPDVTAEPAPIVDPTPEDSGASEDGDPLDYLAEVDGDAMAAFARFDENTAQGEILMGDSDRFTAYTDAGEDAILLYDRATEETLTLVVTGALKDGALWRMPVSGARWGCISPARARRLPPFA